jgi:hypothetical protein
MRVKALVCSALLAAGLGLGNDEHARQDARTRRSS